MTTEERLQLKRRFGPVMFMFTQRYTAVSFILNIN